MSRGNSHTLLVCTQDENQLEWLKNSLESLGSLIQVDENLGELLSLVEVMEVSVVFINVDQQQQIQQCALIEGLLEVHPLLSVIALGGAYDGELAIPAMRAGARDFLSYGLRSGEVIGLVRRQISRLPHLPERSEHGEVSLICSAQPDADSSFLATHVALALSGNEEARVLVVDLGIPCGESTAILNLEVKFYFEDAVRNFRRLDLSVIESAFSRHESGLHLLPLSDGSFRLEQVSPAEMLLLMGSLRQHFSRIIINTCGQEDSSMLRTLAGSAERILWYANQTVACSIRTLDLLTLWRKEGVRLKEGGLVVDHYIGRMAPDAETLTKTFDLPLAAKLPPSAGLRLECKNFGSSLYELASKDPLSRELRKLADRFGRSHNTKPRSLLQRLRGRT